MTGGRRTLMIDVEAPPLVPGFALDRGIGVGEHQVWRAVDLGSMRPVTVQVGPQAGRPGSVAREAAQLRRIDHPNAARLRAVIDLTDGRRAVVLDLVPEVDLATLVARRGALPPGEAVPLAIALARALEHVHALGLGAGRLSPHDVLFAPDGRPVLAGVAVPSLLAGNSPSVPADDVRALGEVLRFALTGGRPDVAVTGPLAPLVTLCLGPDPAGRPSPPEIAAMARKATAAVAVRIDTEPLQQGQAEANLEGHRRRPGRLRGWPPVVVAALAVALAVSMPRHSARIAGLDDPQGLVSALAAARADALGSRSESALGLVDAVGSAALAADEAFLARLRRDGVTLRRLGFDVADVHVLDAGPTSAVLQARVTASGYDEVGSDHSARRMPRGTPRTVRLTLLRTPAGWRIADVR